MVSLGGLPPSFVQNAVAVAQSPITEQSRVLVLLQLAGGNDGLNTVIPYGDDAYYRARPGISIPETATLKLDDYHGLHPMMQGFKSLYDEGMLSVVQGVGYPNPNRSHFRSTDIWHSAVADTESTQDGWLGRAIDHKIEQRPGEMPALALGVERLPLALLSSNISIPAVKDISDYQLQLGGGRPEDRQQRQKLMLELLQQPAEADSDLEFLRQTGQSAFDSAKRLEEVTSTYQPAAEYPATALAEKLKLVAQLIAGKFETRIFFLSLGGFDTHSRQAGAHQSLLTDLSSAVQAFYSDLAGHGQRERVLLATYSEFGRRVQENGSLGTDHGAASQMFIVNPHGAGGIHGDHPSLTDLAEGDLKFHTDFRSVYATILDKWLDIPSRIVLGSQYPTLGFI